MAAKLERAGHMRFSNRRAIVTGAASGIGAAVSARIEAEGGQAAVWDMNGGIRVDVANYGSVENALAETLKIMGGVAAMINLPPGARTTTLESKTNFVAPAPLGSRVLGETTPVHKGRTTMIWQTRITLESGRLVALVTQTQLVLPGKI